MRTIKKTQTSFNQPFKHPQVFGFAPTSTKVGVGSAISLPRLSPQKTFMDDDLIVRNVLNYSRISVHYFLIKHENFLENKYYTDVFFNATVSCMNLQIKKMGKKLNVFSYFFK